MNVLAFDTCLGAVSTAAGRRGPDGQWQLATLFDRRVEGHAESLMPMIGEVMQRSGLRFSDLDRIAVTAGPGTFTGVRVGVAAARGLALASGVPTVAASSLAVMGHRARQVLAASLAGRQVLVAVDAGRGMVYAELAPGEPVLAAPEQAAARFAPLPLVVVGSGAGPVAEAIAAAGGAAEALLPDLEPDACDLAVMAADLVPAAPLRPLYLRPPDVRPQAGKSLPRALP